MNDLEMYRESLALCDDKIIDALVERSKIVEKIMAYKEEYGMPILQPQQEAKQALRLEEKLNGNKYREEIKDIFECIRMNSKKIQARKFIRLQYCNDRIYGSWKINSGRVFKYHVCHGSCRDGSGNCERGRNEYSGYFCNLWRRIFP